MTHTTTPTKSSSKSFVLSTPAKPPVPDLIKQMRNEAAVNASLKPLFEKCKTETLTLKHANNKKSMLTFVHQINDEKWFWKNAKKSGGLFDQIEFMSSGEIDPSTSEPSIVSLLLDTIHKKYPVTFKKHVQAKKIVEAPSRLTVHESVAMMKDCNFTQTQMRKINRHMHHHLNYRPLAPDNDIRKFNSEAPVPKISVQTIPVPPPKSDTNKGEVDGDDPVVSPTEDMLLMTHNVGDILEAHVLRYLNSNKNTHLPLDYTISENIGDGVLQLIGTDHGQGFSQFLIQSLLLSSTQRRIHKKAHFGSLHLPLAVAKCKKEGDAIDRTVDVISSGITLLKTSQLFGIRNKKGEFVHAVFIPVDATNVVLKNHGNNEYKISYTFNEVTHLVDAVSGDLVSIVRKFLVAVVGDLSAIMHVQNRKDMAPHECILCEKRRVNGVINHKAARISKMQISEKLTHN